MSEPNTAGVVLFPVKERYDPEEFLTSATDAKGHGERFWFRAPSGLLRQIEIFLAAKRFPYKSATDILRHALIRHLTWLGTLEPDVDSVMRQVEAVQDLMREEQYNQDFISMFEDLGKTVYRYLAGGHNGEAMRMIGRCRDTFEKMPEGFWRDQYLAELMKRFGHLLEGDGASLVTKGE
jgi:hypothetical protein